MGVVTITAMCLDPSVLEVHVQGDVLLLVLGEASVSYI